MLFIHLLGPIWDILRAHFGPNFEEKKIFFDITVEFHVLELTHPPMFFSPFENIHLFVLLCTIFAYFRTQFKAAVTSLCPYIGHTTTN